MKKFQLIILMLLCTTAFKSNAQTPTQKHRFSAGPFFGYDYTLKAPAFGAGLFYEYKPFNNLGFISGFNYEFSRKSFSEETFQNKTDGIINHQIYSLSAGARYYWNSLYLSGTLGIARETGKTQLDNETTYDGGSANSLYKSLGIGYQIALNNGDMMEFEIGTFGTKNSMKLGGTVRYKLLK